MARRGSRPSLYELGAHRLGRSQQSPDVPRNPEAVPTVTPRRISLPVGFLVVGVLCVLGVVLAAWWMGRTAGHEAEQAARASQLAMRVSADPLTPAAKPTTQAPDAVPATASVRTDPVVSTAPKVPVEAVKPGLEAIPDGSPFKKGLYYIVLAETRPKGAEALKSFCEANGLAVAFDPGHNARNVRVIALPGLTSSDPKASANQALAEQIKEVADRWLKSKREVIFHDTYYQRM